jgi:hypothetical protein
MKKKPLTRPLLASMALSRDGSQDAGVISVRAKLLMDRSIAWSMADVCAKNA